MKEDLKLRYNDLQSYEFKSSFNRAILSGTIKNEPELKVSTYNSYYYEFVLIVKRLSGKTDEINLMCFKDNSFFDGEKLKKDAFIRVEGRYRLYRVGEHLKTFFIADTIIYYNEPHEINVNKLQLKGSVHGNIKPRITKKGINVTEVVLKVIRKSREKYLTYDYIPCVTWGENAKFVAKLQEGENVLVNGRMQIREVVDKKNGNIRYVHEVAVDCIEKC